MQICVCVKQTPDSSSVYIDPISGQVDVERFVQILNPADACAVEAAVRLKEQVGGFIEVITVGPADAEGTLRAALALGANRATRLWHTQASEWGPFTVSTVLAAYIQQQLPQPDLILCGDTASDWSSGIVGPAMAERLHLPQVTSVSRLDLLPASAEDIELTLLVTRKLERGYRERLGAHLPLLITVTSDLNEPRYPSLPAHIAALRANISVENPLPLLSQSIQEEAEETVLLEMHTPRPRARHVPTPDSHHSAFERIGEIIMGGATGRQTRLVEGTNEELAQVLVNFLREKGFVE
ncbi:MAG: electron transfer flavoprotein subunit beta/FixA family protein [Ktedonobacteraceae bacterium]